MEQIVSFFYIYIFVGVQIHMYLYLYGCIQFCTQGSEERGDL